MIYALFAATSMGLSGLMRAADCIEMTTRSYARAYCTVGMTAMCRCGAGKPTEGPSNENKVMHEVTPCYVHSLALMLDCKPSEAAVARNSLYAFLKDGYTCVKCAQQLGEIALGHLSLPPILLWTATLSLAALNITSCLSSSAAKLRNLKDQKLEVS